MVDPGEQNNWNSEVSKEFGSEVSIKDGLKVKCKNVKLIFCEP